MAGAVLATALTMQSCHLIDDGEGDCSVKYLVELSFTKNIMEVDAFASKVPSVTLLVYNKSGELVTSKSESGSALQKDHYTMEIDVEPGTYDLLVWCGLEGSNAFSLDGGQTPSTLRGATCTMSRDGGVSSRQLSPLFHAVEQNVNFPDNSRIYGDVTVAKLDLTKNTNTIRVILTHYNGQDINPNDFSFTITDNNGKMNWDNSLMSDETISYTPWTKKSLEASDEFQGRATVTNVNSMMAEIDVARLMTTQNPRLTIQAAGKSEAVLSLPITQLLLHSKGDAKSQMSDQEFLDRQDEYNIMFFLNDDDGWYMDGGIYINGWHMRYQSADM